MDAYPFGARVQRSERESAVGVTDNGDLAGGGLPQVVGGGIQEEPVGCVGGTEVFCLDVRPPPQQVEAEPVYGGYGACRPFSHHPSLGTDCADHGLRLVSYRSSGRRRRLPSEAGARSRKLALGGFSP